MVATSSFCRSHSDFSSSRPPSAPQIRAWLCVCLAAHSQRSWLPPTHTDWHTDQLRPKAPTDTVSMHSSILIYSSTFIHPSILRPSICIFSSFHHPSINSYIHQIINPFASIHPSIHPAIINPSIILTRIKPSFIHPFINLSIICIH